MAIKEAHYSGYSIEGMLEEAKAMITVSKHNHIVNFHGISVHMNKVYMLLEFCSFGSIDNYVQSNSIKLGAMLEHQDFKQIVSWCKQVADGMEYLVAKGIIHVRLRNQFYIIANLSLTYIIENLVLSSCLVFLKC